MSTPKEVSKMRHPWLIRPLRKHWFVPALVVLLVGVWAWSASAVSGPQTFSLVEVSIPKNDRPLGDFEFDRPPVGGDQFVVKNALYKNGARVGRVEVLHTFITGFGSDFSHKATVLFVAQVYLHSGTMLVQGYGRVNPDGPSKLTFPIVGGTGTYADVRGYLNVRNVTKDKTRLEFHLLP